MAEKREDNSGKRKPYAANTMALASTDWNLQKRENEKERKGKEEDNEKKKGVDPSPPTTEKWGEGKEGVGDVGG